MRVCFLIPDGVGIRNYLYSPILPLLNAAGAEIVVWHGLDPEVITQSKELHPGLFLKEFPFVNHREDPIAQLLRDSVSYARLVLNSRKLANPTILDNWLPKKTLKGKVSNLVATRLGKTIKSEKQIIAVEKIVNSKNQKSHAYFKYKKELENIKPDILFCTHQRMPNAGIAMLAAKDMGIKTVVAIFSWDNLPKGRLPVRADDYLVWSAYMKDELAFYFSNIDQQRVHIVGTPQFDFYKNQEIFQSKEKFAASNGLNAQKHWICFSGDDSLTSPHDPLYLNDLAENLKAHNNIQILFRPVPVEGHQRYVDVLERHPNIVLMQPKWKHGKAWNTFFPYYEDIAVLVNLARHSAAVINVGSTMALDFAQFDKPGLYVNYDVKPDHPWSVNRTYQFQHFRTMDGLHPVGWINSPEEIESKIIQAIEYPYQVGPDRNIWKEKIVFEEKGILASQKIADWLSQLQNSKL